MTTRGRDDLANEALNILMETGAGQSPDAEDTEYCVSKIDGLFSELSARDVVTVADPEDIEDAFFDALAELLANACAPHFGKPKDEGFRLAAEGRLAVMVNRGELAN